MVNTNVNARAKAKANAKAGWLRSLKSFAFGAGISLTTAASVLALCKKYPGVCSSDTLNSRRANNSAREIARLTKKHVTDIAKKNGQIKKAAVGGALAGGALTAGLGYKMHKNQSKKTRQGAFKNVHPHDRMKELEVLLSRQESINNAMEAQRKYYNQELAEQKSVYDLEIQQQKAKIQQQKAKIKQHNNYNYNYKRKELHKKKQK